ncbi:MAG: autotransporter domain-containing protein [Alphaproteobacteria bacterium]|nr:autotransporter domain-containing protein [Alphaproteobacteria bacterium]
MRMRTGLMSSISAFAVMAAFGAPAIAAEIFGPGRVPAIVNHDTIDSIQIPTGTTVRARGRQSLTNTGTIAGSSAGVTIWGAQLSGGISNTGVIDSASIGLNLVAGTTVQGAQNWTTIGGSVTNTGSIDGDWTAINTFFTSIEGTVTNTGSIVGGSGINGFLTIVEEGVINDDGGIIEATASTGRALQFLLSTIDGGIVNHGTIAASGDSAIAVNAGAVALSGGFTNTGLISASGLYGHGVGISFGKFTDGLFLSDGTLRGDIVNEGTVFAGGGGIALSGGEGYAGGTVIGNFINKGLIEGVLGQAVIIYNVAKFDGDVFNAGTIHSVYGAAFMSAGSDIHGDIINTQSGKIISDTYHGIFFFDTVTHANIANHGQIVAGGVGIQFYGVQATEADAPSIYGSITNAGEICGAGGGINVISAKVFGSIVNTGTIHCAASAAGVFVLGDITGDVTNTGLISAAQGIYVQGEVGGAMKNSGAINASGVALGVGGHVSGGISNSGTLIGSVGVDLTSATAGNTIKQKAGLIQANGIPGSSFALSMTNGFADTFVGARGTLDGDVIVDEFDRFNFTAPASFAWLRGTTYGTLADFSKSGPGTLFLGALARGGQTTDALSANTLNMALAAGGLYLDDQATIGITGTYTQSASSTLEFFLTSDTAVHGHIAAGSLILGGKIAAYVDPVTLAAASVPVGATFSYEDVLTGERTGTFSNGTNLLTSSPFFNGTVIYNASDIDLQLTRIAFSQAFPNATANQRAVGKAFDNLTQGNNLSGGMNALVAAVFAGSWNFDELSGAQFTQLQSATQSVTSTINTMVGERLAGVSFAPSAPFGSDNAFVSSTEPDGTPSKDGTSIWLRRVGEDTAAGTSTAAPGYAQSASGLVAGIDTKLTDTIEAGVAYAHAQSEIGFTTRGDSARIDTWQMNAYGNFQAGRFFAGTQASYGRHDVVANRMIDLPLLGSTRATADYAAASWSASGEVGATWKAGAIELKPAVELAYIGMSIDPFTESGSSYALQGAGSRSNSLASTVALAVTGEWALGRTKITPTLKLGWCHEFADRSQTLNASFLDGSDADTTMLIASSEAERDTLVVSASTSIVLGQNTQAILGLNGRYDATETTTDASAGIRFTW